MNRIESQRQEINLYTPEFRRADQSFSFYFICRCCVVLFTVLMLVEGYSAWALRNNGDRLQKLQVTQQEVTDRLKRLQQSQPLSQRPKLETTFAQLQQQVQQRRELEKIMSGQKLGNFDGFSPFLISLARRANKDMALTQIHLLEGGNTLQLQGWTRVPEAVPRYLQDLRSEPSFEQVRFGVLHIEKDTRHAHKLKFMLGKTEDNPT